MKKNRKNKTMLLALLVVAITSMTIVFAAMSTNLKIKGAGLVSTDGWSIKFENLAGVLLKGEARETTAPTIKSDTEIGDYVVVLRMKGDEVVYNFDIHNYGKLNAKIEELNIQTPVCTGNAEDEAQKIADAQIVSESLNYTLTYSDGTEVKVGDTLKAEEVKNLTLKLAYTGKNIPSESVQITGLSVSIKYAQDMSTGGSTEPSIDPTEIAGKRYDEETRIVSDGIPVTIPGGATISAIPGEYESANNGLVMYVVPAGEEITDWNADTNSNGILDVQENYDQFVWVPVENPVLDLSAATEENVTSLSSDDNLKAAIQKEIDNGRYPMAVKKDESEYFGIIYDFELDSETNLVKIIPMGNNWSPIKWKNGEPDFSDNTVFYHSPEITSQLLQKEFNDMVREVMEKKGFWIGKYETSHMNGGASEEDERYDSTQKVKVIKGANEGTNGNNINWSRMYLQQRNYSKLTSTLNARSTMIWGSQYCQVMIWMKDIKNDKDTVTTNSYYILNSIGMGNYMVNADGSEKTNKKMISTGSVEDYKVKNIYDLAGNLGETTIFSKDSYRVVFGGSYITTSSKKSAFTYEKHQIQYSENGFGSRMVLY